MSEITTNLTRSQLRNEFFKVLESKHFSYSFNLSQMADIIISNVLGIPEKQILTDARYKRERERIKKKITYLTRVLVKLKYIKKITNRFYTFDKNMNIRELLEEIEGKIPTKELLVKKYIQENKSIKEMSDELKITESVIQSYINEYNIGRGEIKPIKIMKIQKKGGLNG